MIEIKSIPYITCADVEKLTGKHWNNFEFADMAENDSYQILDCSDEALEDLLEDYQYEKEEEDRLTIENFATKMDYDWHLQCCRMTCIKNQIDLIKILREQYEITKSILVWISW